MYFYVFLTIPFWLCLQKFVQASIFLLADNLALSLLDGLLLPAGVLCAQCCACSCSKARRSCAGCRNAPACRSHLLGAALGPFHGRDHSELLHPEHHALQSSCCTLRSAHCCRSLPLRWLFPVAVCLAPVTTHRMLLRTSKLHAGCVEPAAQTHRSSACPGTKHLSAGDLHF